MALPSAHVLFQLHPLSLYCCRNPCPGLQSDICRILGVALDSRLSFDAHISALSKSCFYHIRALRHIRSNRTLDCSKGIACSLVGCRLDYVNSTLVRISVENISRLQRLQSALARFVTCQRGRIGISKTLQELHWLPIK